MPVFNTLLSFNLIGTPMLTTEEINVILQFLDRVAITGHQERNAMNVVVEKLTTLAKTPETTPAISGD